MKVYSAKILLNGSRENEVRRTDLTAPEVLILKLVHGPEFVSEVKLVGEIERTEREERIRLLGDGGEKLPIYHIEYVRKVFPSDLTPFPKELPAEMIDVAGMEMDFKQAAIAPGKAIEDMTEEELDAENQKLTEAQKRMAKARAARKFNKKDGAAQSATLD